MLLRNVTAKSHRVGGPEPKEPIGTVGNADGWQIVTNRKCRRELLMNLTAQMQKIADEYKQEAEDFDADLVSDSDGNYCFLSKKYEVSCHFFSYTPIQCTYMFMQIVLDSEVLPDIQLGPRKEEPPTEIPTVIPETDSEDEIIVVDEIPPKDDPGLARPSASGLIPPPPSPQASNGDKMDVQMTPSQQPGANDLLTQR